MHVYSTFFYFFILVYLNFIFICMYFYGYRQQQPHVLSINKHLQNTPILPHVNKLTTSSILLSILHGCYIVVNLSFLCYSLYAYNVCADTNPMIVKSSNHKMSLYVCDCTNVVYMCVGATKGTYRRDIKMIVNHDYIKQCIIFAKNFFR